MITSIVIISVSVALFAYWFRYSCLLILSAKTARDYSFDVARANQLNFFDVHGALRGVAGIGAAQLDTLQDALNDDYRALASLTRHTLCFGAGGCLESAMVHIDFRLMRAWYGITRLAFPVQAQMAVSEMAEIIRYFANSVGERSQTSEI